MAYKKYPEDAADEDFIFKVENEFEILQTENLTDKQKFVSYGFGTINTFGTFISMITGDIIGSVKVENTANVIIKHSDNKNYKITIEEI